MSESIGQRIVCAAIRNQVDDVIAGVRHFDHQMRRLIELSGFSRGAWSEQGFLDNRGNFLDRVQAREVAEGAGQIIRRVGGDERELFSENLY